MLRVRKGTEKLVKEKREIFIAKTEVYQQLYDRLKTTEEENRCSSGLEENLIIQVKILKNS